MSHTKTLIYIKSFKQNIILMEKFEIILANEQIIGIFCMMQDMNICKILHKFKTHGERN